MISHTTALQRYAEQDSVPQCCAALGVAAPRTGPSELPAQGGQASEGLFILLLLPSPPLAPPLPRCGEGEKPLGLDLRTGAG